VFRGCNVENASFGLSICAERNAVWKAVSEGARDFVAVAIAAPPGSGASPCGACRQVLQEFAPELVVHWRDARGRRVSAPLRELLPRPFSELRRGRP
jgi:cytidine deaminase